MAKVSDQPFGAEYSAYSEEQWQSACVLDKGDGTPEERYALPVRQPDGQLNTHLLTKASEELAGPLEEMPERAIEKAQARLAKRYLKAGLPVRTELAKAVLSGKERDQLPDSDFGYIEPGGAKDGSGKTAPRSKRHFPIRDAGHVRAALTRIAQGAEFSAQAKPKVQAAAKRLGIDVAKAEQPLERSVPIWKDDSKQVVYGVVLEPELPDSQGDVIAPQEIEKAAHDYLVQSRKSDVQHSEVTTNFDGEPIGEVVESYIAPEDMTVSGQAVRKGAWVMGMHVADAATWTQVAKGELTGFSIGGTGERVPLAA